MTTTVLLIRHGQTDWNAADRWQGHSDVPLNEVGRRQAQSLARRLSSWPISTVYSSDLKRAAETARILAAALDLEPVYDSAWRERRGGKFEGLTASQIEQQHPQAWARVLRGVIDPPGGEMNAELHERVTAAFDELLGRHKDETIAVVSHGGALRKLIGYVLDLPPDHSPRLHLDGNTGISIVENRERRPPALVRLNDVAHLELDGFA